MTLPTIEEIRAAKRLLKRALLPVQPITPSMEELCIIAKVFFFYEESYVAGAPVIPELTVHKSISAADTPEANRRQVGGKHYGLGARQHWDLVIEFGWDYFQGQITKYLMRWRKKNGIEDLEKAKHYLEKYIEEAKAGRVV